MGVSARECADYGFASRTDEFIFFFFFLRFRANCTCVRGCAYVRAVYACACTNPLCANEGMNYFCDARSYVTYAMGI